MLIDELDEKRESQYWLQLRLLERELRLVFAVLEHIECLERPSEEMNCWAEEARDVVRSVEDMMDTLMMTL